MRETLRFLAVNAAAVARYGYSREEFLARTIRDIRPADQVEPLERHVSALGEGLEHGGTWCHQLRNGERIEVVRSIVCAGGYVLGLYGKCLDYETVAIGTVYRNGKEVE